MFWNKVGSFVRGCVSAVGSVALSVKNFFTPQAQQPAVVKGFASFSPSRVMASSTMRTVAAIALVCVIGAASAHAQTGPGALITADDETGDLTLNVLPYALKMMGYIVTVIGAAMVLWYIRPILGWIKGAITGRR